jgi:hypothetical protein
MRLRVFFGLGAIAACAAACSAGARTTTVGRERPTPPTSATGSSAQITVAPASGGPKTTFTITFTAPSKTGKVGAMERTDAVTFTGPARRSRCVSSGGTGGAASAAGARVRVKLDPSRFGGRWCVGTFHGQIEETGRPICSAGQLCPQFVVVLHRIGTFRFTVRRG